MMPVAQAGQQGGSGFTGFPQIFLVAVCAGLVGVGAWRESGRGSGVDPEQLGRLADRLADSGADQAEEALRAARLAIEKDPASPFRWCDLGELYLNLRPGDSAQARECFRRAEQIAPGNPNILLRIANFYYQTGEVGEAVRRSYEVLRQVRQFDDVIFSSYSRFGVPQAEILAQGVPPEPGPVQSYLRFLFARDDVAAAGAAWRWAARISPSPVTDPLARDYVNLLWR